VTAGIGFSIFLFVVGAILTFAVEVDTSGFNINTVGIILMVGGLLGLFASVLFGAASRLGAVVGRWPRTPSSRRRIERDLP
jgi:hypothetical protein